MSTYILKGWHFANGWIFTKHGNQVIFNDEIACYVIFFLSQKSSQILLNPKI